MPPPRDGPRPRGRRFSLFRVLVCRFSLIFAGFALDSLLRSPHLRAKSAAEAQICSVRVEQKSGLSLMCLCSTRTGGTGQVYHHAL